jgi:hypothetical protein
MPLPPHRRESICEYSVAETTYRTGRAGSMCRCTDIMLFQNPPYRASRELQIPRIAAVGTSLSPLPCKARHGYMVTSAQRVEVEVCADGPASAPLSGAAAVAPPADVYSRGELALSAGRASSSSRPAAALSESVVGMAEVVCFLARLRRIEFRPGLLTLLQSVSAIAAGLVTVSARHRAQRGRGR